MILEILLTQTAFHVTVICGCLLFVTVIENQYWKEHKVLKEVYSYSDCYFWKILGYDAECRHFNQIQLSKGYVVQLMCRWHDCMTHVTQLPILTGALISSNTLWTGLWQNTS